MPKVIRDGWHSPGLLSTNYPEGIYGNPIDVTLTSTSSDKIIYTLDGTEPTASHGSTYTGAIPIKADTVVKAIGLKGSNIVNRATLNFELPPLSLRLEVRDS